MRGPVFRRPEGEEFEKLSNTALREMQEGIIPDEDNTSDSSFDDGTEGLNALSVAALFANLKITPVGEVCYPAGWRVFCELVSRRGEDPWSAADL